ncbi:MAG: outer membrane protein assembly factor BamD [Bacteroidia bacterium]|nr:outer membrane protein assembly factor BamD [Bacteroidia bacterium]
MKFRLLYLVLGTMFVLPGCSQYSRMLKSRDMDQKLEYAIQLYDKKEYYKALPLFEELITVFRGTKQAEKTYYYYSYTNYQLGDYETAAYDFENFARTFPASEFAEECAFMHAYCYYQDSPLYSLDQTNTLKAINELQLFINRYPASRRLDECNRLIDQLRDKLELKNYENAKLYYNMDEYKAAVTAFQNLVHDFPNSVHRETVLFLIVKSSYLLARNSIEEKKMERFKDALKYYNEFVTAFPESKFRNEADDIAGSVRKSLNAINGDDPVSLNQKN